MQPTTVLVDSARADIVDEAALTEVLQKGTIADFGLDVFEREPTNTEALTTMKNVCLLPDLDSATRKAREAMGMTVVRNFTDFFGGRELPNRVV